MPSNEERREIAAMLRDMCIYGCSWKEEFYDLLGEAVMDESSVYEFDDVARRLADLIEPEERTCRDECGGELDFHCSECGCHLYLISIENEPSLMLGEAAIQPSFCPNCGARVVKEDGE